ncbi:hypothetical protein ZIOFF_039431 [Zingiber officinale]|uniref:Chalcone--flavanone isomerase n=2 Tax=Zingiber officinale TaxID=94328 RepID=A0A8J5G4I4_ZINOF|nr:hypothetical protein ZIOFF_039431 [Zingiber officinale]
MPSLTTPTTMEAELVQEETREENEQKTAGDEAATKLTMEKEKDGMEVEPKTGVPFPVKLPNGMQLQATGLRRKKILGFGLNIYAFGIYGDIAGLKQLLRPKHGEATEMATKEMYESVINSDVGMVVRLVIVFGGLTMSLVKKNFDEGLGASLKKLTSDRTDEELITMVLGAAKDSMKLPAGTVIEITRFPDYVLQTKVTDELVSKVKNELLCRAFFHMYLGDDAFDKEAKEKFGASLLSLF